MKAPTTAFLRRWTGEPHLALDQGWLNDAFGGDPSRALQRWQASRGEPDAGLGMGSRRGLVGFWEACRLRHRSTGFDPALYAAITAAVWVEGKRDHACREFQVCEPGELVEAMRPFALSSVLMSDNELAAFCDLPDPVLAYRGGCGPELAKGHSWSLRQDVAQWFADAASSGMVVSALLPKSSVVAFFSDRAEGELVVAL